MGVLFRIEDVNVCELDVEKLVNRVERARDGEVVFQLNHDNLAHERLKHRVKNHLAGLCGAERERERGVV